MKRLKRLIVRVVAWAVAEDYRANGVTRQMLIDDLSGGNRASRLMRDVSADA